MQMDDEEGSVGTKHDRRAAAAVKNFKESHAKDDVNITTRGSRPTCKNLGCHAAIEAYNNACSVVVPGLVYGAVLRACARTIHTATLELAAYNYTRILDRNRPRQTIIVVHPRKGRRCMFPVVHVRLPVHATQRAAPGQRSFKGYEFLGLEQ